MALPYRFAMEDAWREHLQEEGFVVLSAALAPEEVEVAKDLLWKDLEASYKISRHDMETWKKWRLSPTGLETSVVQDRGAWYLRSRGGVRSAFAALWGPELIVSMDAVLLWRPWQHVAAWRPQVEPLHLDQNPFHKPDLEVVQGMVPLLPVTESSGGLQVVPRSHRPEAKGQLKEDYPELAFKGDWCPLMVSHPDAQLLCAEPGDLILWDARTVHGGLVGKGGGGRELVRMAVTVSMVPRAWATEEVLRQRREGFLQGKVFNHSPHEAGSSTGTLRSSSRRSHRLEELAPEELALL